MNSSPASSLSNSTDGSSAPVWWETFNLVNTGPLGILVAIAIVGNTLTIAAVVKFRHLRDRHCTLITSLAVADVLVGVAWGIFLATMLYPLWCSVDLDHVDLMFLTFPSVVSHLHILVLAIDRFIAIKFPFKYVTWMSEKHIKISIAVVWVFAFIYILTFLPWALNTPNRSCSEDGPLSTYVVSTQFVIYLLVVCSIVMIYSHINRVAKLQVNKVNVTNTTTAADAEQTCTSSDVTQRNTSGNQKHKPPVTPKATKFMIAVIVAYLVTWTPYFLVALSGIIKPRLISTSVVWQVMMRISIYFMLLNSCLNIFIYAVYITGFRKAYKSILSCSSK